MTGEFAVAVHGLVYLNHKQCSLSSEALAENICTHPARVRKVMACLKKAGLVTTKEGVDGGYYFPHRADTVTLAQVGQALKLCYVSANWSSGDTDMVCLVASGMAGIMDQIYSDMSALCADYLSHVTIGDIDRKIFGQKEESL